ncbi:MAG: wax ester/triacylglycerol synthase family O-acyltransferase [Gammaproteobacteria bacterium]|nr:wax ester/triacylglycerol synthase family O-acyltransferase [Gammaproteobacteria bacterium]
MNDPHLQFNDELDAFDHLMLRGERNPKTRSSMLAVFLLDKVPDFDELTETFERASRSFVRLRQSVALPSLPVTPPRWLVDPDFDLHFHLRRAALPAPARQQQLLDYCNQFLADPLDLERPLWEAVLLENVKIAGCKAALALKIHHAVTDGIGGLKLLEQLLDFAPDAPKRPMPHQPIPEELSGDELLKSGLLRQVGKFIPNVRSTLHKGLAAGSNWIQNPQTLMRTLREQAESARRVLGPLPVPPSPLLQKRSTNRHLSALEFPLAELRRAAKSVGATVNDAYLAAIAAGLREYHETRNITLRELTVSMPVNQRRRNDVDAGNRFAAARIVLPVAELDPAKRLARIHAAAKNAVTEPALNLLHHLLPVMAKLPEPALESIAANLLVPEIQASNIPGPPIPTYLNGCKVVKIYPFGPVPGVASMITMISANGTCFVGINSDTAAFTDPELFLQCLQRGFDEVIALAPPAATKPDSGKKRTPRKRTASKKAPVKKASAGQAVTEKAAAETEKTVNKTAKTVAEPEKTAAATKKAAAVTSKAAAPRAAKSRSNGAGRSSDQTETRQ